MGWGRTNPWPWLKAVCKPLAIVQPKLDGLNCLWLMCSNQSQCKLSQDTELGTENLTFQSTVIYVIFKILSTKLDLVWNYTALYLHGKSWALTKDVFTKENINFMNTLKPPLVHSSKTWTSTLCETITLYQFISICLKKVKFLSSVQNTNFSVFKMFGL